MRYTGTKSIGIRLPIIHEGDNLVELVVNTLHDAQENKEILVNDKDVIAITESIVARAQGNYVDVNDIANDVNKLYFEGKEGKKELVVIFPIMSRNRFSLILKGIARACDKLYIVLSPSDEVGNILVKNTHIPMISDSCIYANPESFNFSKHQFTGVDYMELYREIAKAENCEAKIYVTSYAKEAIDFFSEDVHNILCADIHTRQSTVNDVTKMINILAETGHVYKYNIHTLTDLCCEKSDVHGYNEEYGVLGSNKMSETTLKLFPRNCTDLCNNIQKQIKETFDKSVEVMVYGDGAFKDPTCGIWELADPVVSPGYTEGLNGTPNEYKLKYLADNDFANKSGDEAVQLIKETIRNKPNVSLVGNMASQGTTPRKYVDLLGSLSDLTSGSGDKGTPVVLIQGYFDNYSDDE